MNYDPKDAVKHVVHDYVYLVASGTDTQRPLKHRFNHYAERTFLAHCRAIADFLANRSDSRDLQAQTFTCAPFTRTLPTWEKWRSHINQHLMHLTVARVYNTTPWTGEANKYLLEESVTAWKEFLGELKDELKPFFRDALKAHEEEFSDYPIS